jgi:hypothetical protein
MDVQEFLSEARWTADRVVTNHFGERVWLTHCEGGITDCCRESAPCEYHARLTHAAPGARH